MELRCWPKIVAALIVLSACGSSAPSSATTPSSNSTTAGQSSATATPALAVGPPSPTPAPAGFPTGTYTTNLSADQAHQILALEGTNTLVLMSNGTYTLSSPGEGSTAGVYFVDGQRITFQETDNGAVCGGGASGGDKYRRGTYSWVSSGSALTFTVVADACYGGFRATQISAAPWNKTG